MKTQVTVTSAVGLTDTQRKQLVTGLEKKFGSINLSEKVDEQVIGGVKVTVGSEQFDATLAAKLAKLKQNVQ